MDLSNLKPAEGATHKKKRIGRGQGSGYGGTSTKGNKGAQSRSGYKSKPGFEGGQMPLQRRLPKKGFKNINRVEYRVFNLDQIQHYVDKFGFSSFDVESVLGKRLIQKGDKVKILSRGELSGKIDVSVHAVSEEARKAIESAGGSVTILDK